MEGAQPRGRSGAASAQHWIVLYDGDCGLCKWLLAAILRWDRGWRLRPLALQRVEAEKLLADLSHDERMASWHLVSPLGERYSAGQALSRVLRLLPGGGRAAAATARFPALTELGYGWVAAHRVGLSKLVPARSKRRAAKRVCAREQALNPR